MVLARLVIVSQNASPHALGDNERVVPYCNISRVVPMRVLGGRTERIRARRCLIVYFRDNVLGECQGSQRLLVERTPYTKYLSASFKPRVIIVVEEDFRA